MKLRTEKKNQYIATIRELDHLANSYPIQDHPAVQDYVNDALEGLRSALAEELLNEALNNDGEEL